MASGRFGVFQPRLTRSGCRGARSSRVVVTVWWAPRRTPWMPAMRIRRPTWSRPTEKRARRYACHIFRPPYTYLFRRYRFTMSFTRYASSNSVGRSDRTGQPAVVGLRGDLHVMLRQHGTDRLDPETVPVGVDVAEFHLSRRSSSAWAKNALAVFRMSFARRNSATS